jgi:hypothetical protein
MQPLDIFFSFRKNDISILFTNNVEKPIVIKITDLKVNHITEINLINSEEIKKSLTKFGCTENEIESFLLFSTHNTFDIANANFKIKESCLHTAQNKLDILLYQKNNYKTSKINKADSFILNTCDLNQPHPPTIIKKETYDALDSDIKKVFEPITVNKNSKADWNFIFDFIRNYKEYAYYVSANIYLAGLYKTKATYRIHISINKHMDGFLIDIDKECNTKDYGKLQINAVYLKELIPKLDGLDEDIYTNGLKPLLLDNLENHTIIKYKHKFSSNHEYYINKLLKTARKEIIETGINPLTKDQIYDINQPNIIITDTAISPTNYTLMDTLHEISENYKNELNNCTSKLININEMLDFMSMIIA